MKQSEYIPISVREKIEDKNVAKIVDYLERNAKDFYFFSGENHLKNNYIIQVDNYEFSFDDILEDFYVYKNGFHILEGGNKLLADNIVGIWGSLKHY